MLHCADELHLRLLHLFPFNHSNDVHCIINLLGGTSLLGFYLTAVLVLLNKVRVCVENSGLDGKRHDHVPDQVRRKQFEDQEGVVNRG